MPVKIIRTPKEDVDNALGVQSSITLVDKAEPSEQDAKILHSTALDTDDEFEDYYDLGDSAQNKPQVIRPPYNPSLLYKMTHENNALGQCVAAYEVNIDGTGYDIKPEDETKETEEESTKAKGIKEFFNEVYPGISFTTLRRKLRKDVETTGNGYLEVLRSVEGNITFLKHVYAKNVRLIKLDDAVPVEHKVTRFGSDESITMMMRQRRFVQMVGKKLVYFKEFGVERKMSKSTGHWEDDGHPVEDGDNATEILWLTAEQDALSPYGIPRWIRQAPSVLGSRKAEELNLEYFDAGGLPPALIILQGGALKKGTKEQLQTYLTGKGANKHRAAIVEAHSLEGTLDKAAGVRVMVERFGSERATDSMFEGYDDKCEKRVRTSFRLPPLFVGRTDDYSYASAFASYTVAEAQVFRPEREEFDERINVTIMKELVPGYKLCSQSLTVNDIAQKLEALGLIKDAIERDSLVEVVSEMTDMALTVKEEEEPPPMLPGAPVPGQQPNAPPAGQAPPQQPADGANGVPGEEPSRKMDSIDMLSLAEQWAAFTIGDEDALMLTQGQMVELIKSLDKRDKDLFDGYVTIKLMNHTENDLNGIRQLTSAAADLLGGCDC